jgi:hypothetical protein
MANGWCYWGREIYLNGQSEWLKYSQEIQARSLQVCSLEVVSAKALRTEIFKALNQAHNLGYLATRLHEINQLLKITNQAQQQIEITGGQKNFGRSRDIAHFSRADGCWFDFAITVSEARKSAEVIGFDFEMRFPEIMPVQFVRFDLNLPGHDNQTDGLRFHLHPGSDDLMIHSPPMSPLEILHLFLYRFEIPRKVRQTNTL